MIAMISAYVLVLFTPMEDGTTHQYRTMHEFANLQECVNTKHAADRLLLPEYPQYYVCIPTGLLVPS